MTDDVKRVLLELADGSPFGPVAVRRLLGCRAKGAERRGPRERSNLS